LRSALMKMGERLWIPLFVASERVWCGRHNN
jgi:hypothetical protein